MSYNDDIVSRALLHGLLGSDLASRILDRVDDVVLSSMDDTDVLAYIPAYAYTA